MTSILKAEFYKLRHNAGLKILPPAAVIWSLVIACFMLFVASGATVEGEVFTNEDVFGFNPTGAIGVQALAAISNLYAMSIVVFAGLFVSTEFTQGTIRNAICAGISRTKIYVSKLIVSAAVLALCMLLSCLTFIVSFTIMYGFGSSSGFIHDTVIVFVMQFLYHFTYAGIGCMLAFLIPNIVLTIAIGIIVVIFSGVLVEVCSAFDMLNSIAPLIPQYYVSRLNEQSHNTAFLVTGAAVCVAFTAAATVIGCTLFNRQDIK
jgi:ABC-2 type transport system permease protein